MSWREGRPPAHKQDADSTDQPSQTERLCIQRVRAAHPLCRPNSAQRRRRPVSLSTNSPNRPAGSVLGAIAKEDRRRQICFLYSAPSGWQSGNSSAPAGGNSLEWRLRSQLTVSAAEERKGGGRPGGQGYLPTFSPTPWLGRAVGDWHAYKSACLIHGTSL